MHWVPPWFGELAFQFGRLTQSRQRHPKPALQGMENRCALLAGSSSWMMPAVEQVRQNKIKLMETTRSSTRSCCQNNYSTGGWHLKNVSKNTKKIYPCSSCPKIIKNQGDEGCTSNYSSSVTHLKHRLNNKPCDWRYSWVLTEKLHEHIEHSFLLWGQGNQKLFLGSVTCNLPMKWTEYERMPVICPTCKMVSIPSSIIRKPRPGVLYRSGIAKCPAVPSQVKTKDASSQINYKYITQRVWASSRFTGATSSQSGTVT